MREYHPSHITQFSNLRSTVEIQFKMRECLFVIVTEVGRTIKKTFQAEKQLSCSKNVFYVCCKISEG